MTTSSAQMQTDECIGFIECRCAKCLRDPEQQKAKRRLAEIRAANRSEPTR